ncbi:MAG: aminoacyl-tRNA hydrolase [Candidatus Moranbacteria bacterium]|nr:aminoacyl-tRNA hydrolase [Candidatus Moranbacteria bacterium]
MNSVDYFIAGLGNPGEKYENTYHNLGFQALDALSKKYDRSNWRLIKKFHIKVKRVKAKKQNLELLKPIEFMNKSGQTLTKYFNYFYPYLEAIQKKIIVIHDDSDIKQGQIQIVKAAGSAGHKGVFDIQEKLGTKNFIRLRIGIRAPDNLDKSTNLVLKRITSEKKLRMVLAKTPAIIETIITQGITSAQNQFH